MHAFISTVSVPFCWPLFTASSISINVSNLYLLVAFAVSQISLLHSIPPREAPRTVRISRNPDHFGSSFPALFPCVLPKMGPLLGSPPISPAKQATKISLIEVKSLKSSVLNQCMRSQADVGVKVVFCWARFGIAEPRTQSALSTRALRPTLLVAEREEAKAVLALFLKKQGLSTATAARTLNKSDHFIDHLVSKLHSIHISRYLVGRELTTLEIRDALIPYLENLLNEHGNAFDEVVENFPDMPGKEKTAEVVSPTGVLESKKLPNVTRESCKLRAMARVSGSTPAEKLPQHVVYLIDLGMELEKIQQVTRKFPAFASYSLEGKVKPLVEFLLDLGVSKSDIPIIIGKRPQLCGISLSENLIPTMKFLESLGLDKKNWANVIYRSPPLLTHSRQKLKSTVDFLHEMGLAVEDVGKVLTRWPTIIGYSVENNLRPTAEYFQRLGVNVSALLPRSPQTFGLSIEGNLKPVTEFFLQRGYTLEDLRSMIQRCGTLYTFSLEKNLIPKWEFFLTMDYQRSELVKFPQYFAYSLGERIKPRYALVRQRGVKLLLNQVLSLSDKEFDKALKRKLKKKLDGVVLTE